MRPLLVPLLDLLWPPRCAACGASSWSAGVMCASCAQRLSGLGTRCRRCGRRVGLYAATAPCAGCRDEAPGLDGVVARWAYEGVPRDLVLGLKYGRRTVAARPLAEGLAEALREADVPGDLVVPVPLSPRRQRARGYNQAEVLARQVVRMLRLECDGRALARWRHTPPQVGLSRARRRRGPRGAFRARPERVRGRSILLVDDVLTTGGTARACAVALRRGGALSVVPVVACRAQDVISGGAPSESREAPESRANGRIMSEQGAVVEVSGRFADELVAREAADALNRWFRWILDGSEQPAPSIFESLGVPTAEYAWTLDEDVDWRLGPHARAVGAEVRVAVETQDTHLRLGGLLKRLGAAAVRVRR